MELIARVPVPRELDAARVRALRDDLARAAAGASRVVVLSGDEGAFCAGMRLADEAAGADLEGAAEGFAELLVALRGMGKPTVAGVDGAALGGGLGLAAACDAVVASERAAFGLPEGLVGLWPAMVMPAVLERVSPQRARLLALDATARSARDAAAMGLVDEVCPAEDLDRAVARRARSLARTAPAAVLAVKRSIGLDAFAQAAREGARATAARLRDPAVRAAMRALAEGEAPWEAP